MIVSDVWTRGPSVEAGDVGQRGAAAGGQDVPVGGHGDAGAGVELVVADEAAPAAVHRDVGALRALPVGPAAGGDRVDPPEDPVAQTPPVDAVDVHRHVELGGPPGAVGEVGGVDEHLRRDAPDVEARARRTCRPRRWRCRGRRARAR